MFNNTQPDDLIPRGRIIEAPEKEKTFLQKLEGFYRDNSSEIIITTINFLALYMITK